MSTFYGVYPPKGGSGTGTVTEIDTGTGLTGGPITTSGTISLIVPVTVVDGGTGQTSLGNLTDAGTDGIVVTGGTGAVITSVSLAQHVSDASHNGYLSSTDWTTFNNKEPAVTKGNLTDAGTDGIVVTGGTGAVIGSGTSLAQHVSDTTHNGYLSSTDWNTFNAKQAALTIGNLTDAGTDGIVVTSGTGAVIGSGTSLAQHVADASHNGYLSSTDWTTFNGKGAGSVTSVAVTVPSVLSVSGSPITTSGTIALSYSGTALPIANGGTAVTSVTTAPAATSFAGWDANKNLSANNQIEGYRTTSTAGATTTLAVGDAFLQYFTGSTTQTVVLPVTSTLVLGQAYRVVNSSSGIVTVQSSGANSIVAMAGGSVAEFTCILTSGTGISSWNYDYGLQSTNGTVTSVAATVPAFLSVSGSPITTSGTLAITVASGTSGGILGYTGTTTLASSALLATNGVVIGGGAGATPTSITAGTNGQILAGVTSGAPAFTNTISGLTGFTGGSFGIDNVRASEGSGTTTLTSSDLRTQVFNLSNGRTCVLPTTNILKGEVWTIIVESSGTNDLTVQSSDTTQMTVANGANLDCDIRLGYVILIALQNAPTTPAHWFVQDVYEVYSLGTITSQNSGALTSNTVTSAPSYVRRGKTASFYWNGTTNGTAQASAASFSFANGTIPTRATPTADVNYVISIRDNGATQTSPGLVQFTTAGAIVIFKALNQTGTFTNSSSIGVPDRGTYTWYTL